ncbi:MAG: hypothetical protein MUP98_08200 [Candidatus Aminicenantes bacterium]|nr:hypothetical protein [Candidatus Aminicenantes bacterium]
MSKLAVVSAFFGILIIVGRAPLVFAPAAAIKIIQKIVNKKSNLRLMGIFTSLLGAAMITSALNADQSFAFIILILGWLIVAAGVIEIVFTSHVQKIAINIWNMSYSKARVLGIISVVLGACFIYLSAVVF